jgi:hypothetical protein
MIEHAKSEIVERDASTRRGGEGDAFRRSSKFLPHAYLPDAPPVRRAFQRVS